MDEEYAPLSDVFATQAIIAVLIGILLLALHLLAPAYLRALLLCWQQTADAAPEIPVLAEHAAAWFASLFSG